MSVKVSAPASTAPFLKNAAGAPVVYFDGVPVFGVFAGNIEIELSTRLLMPKPDGSVACEMSCTAHLRCSPGAAIALADALTKALDMLKKQNDEQSAMLKN
jgi:hypothetical protein